MRVRLTDDYAGLGGLIVLLLLLFLPLEDLQRAIEARLGRWPGDGLVI